MDRGLGDDAGDINLVAGGLPTSHRGHPITVLALSSAGYHLPLPNPDPSPPQLGSFASVRKFAKEVKSLRGPRALDSLVCNAAVYLPAKSVPTFTADGFEESLQINHLGHFLLVRGSAGSEPDPWLAEGWSHCPPLSWGLESPRPRNTHHEADAVISELP